MTGAPIGLLEYLDLSRDTDVSAKRDTAFTGALLAEQLGYRRVWFPEHHGIGSPSTNPMMIVPVVGSHTSRIRVGTAVTLLRMRDQHLHAEDLHTAAAFCGARLDIGIGRGGFGGRGASLLKHLFKDDAQLDRALPELVSALASGNALVAPLDVPYQLWLHGAGGGSWALAAELGANYCHGLFLNNDVDVCTRALDGYRAKAPLGTTAVAVALAANADRARALADARRQPMEVIAGTPEECATTLVNVLTLTGADEVVIAELSSRPEDHYDALRHLHALVAEATTQGERG